MRSILFMAAASLLVLACGSDDDDGGKTGTGGTGGTGGSATGGQGGATGGQGGSATGGAGGVGGAAAACAKCLAEALQGACSTEAAACQAEAGCVAILACAGQCTAGDTVCAQKCVTDNPTGKATFDALAACTDPICTSLCT
ncbi:MAG: hypothetical protein R3B13_39345 [Polyangiaceae bacterium]